VPEQRGAGDGNLAGSGGFSCGPNYVANVGKPHIVPGAIELLLRNSIPTTAPAAFERKRPRVLQPGRNCRDIAKASKAAILIDASEYYVRLEQALRQATKSVLIVGWDFDGRIKLRPDNPESPLLGEFLRSLVEARPDLKIRILVWSGAVVHAPSAALPLLMGAAWQDHPRITLKLDRHHPLYASLHQKIITIDGNIAFVGGIDLTIRRWDTCSHAEANPHRIEPDGSSYRPVHDVQMVVDGEAAVCIDATARERWRSATGEDIAAVNVEARAWPPDLVADFTDIPVAIAHTVPEWGDTLPVKEISALTEDMLASAEHAIYIEAQYFTASNVRRFLTKSLAAKHGPEIVAIVRRSSPGLLERFVMGTNRDRFIRHIRRIDRHNRFRVYYPIVEGRNGPCEVLVHSKVLIVDDELVRIGSSNLSNRSFGLDTECDLAIEALDDTHRLRIAAWRNRLLAEHLDVTPDAVARAVAKHKSLIRGIEALNHSERGLRPFAEISLDGPTEPIAATTIMDPPRPLNPFG
jgi:phosphatidylserine/phosphatidylglycerophosphate/cardiolipin synthase-like enzyme